MLDNEPDTNDNPAVPSATDQTATHQTATDQTAGSGGAPPARRRRRAATRQAGPPSVTAEADPSEPTSATTPAMTAEPAPVADQPPVQGESAPTDEKPPAEPATAAEEAPPAKKTARKRATKAAGDGTARTPRKRATKKAAAEPVPDAAPEALPATDDQTDQTAAPVAATALDEIRTALTAELAPTALTADGPADEAVPAADEDDEAAPVAVDPTHVGAPSAVFSHAVEDQAPVEAATPAAALTVPAATSDAAVSDEAGTDESATTTEPAGTADAGDDDSDDEDEESDGDDESSADDSDESGSPRRRRRRRGGRRRRRGGSGDGEPGSRGEAADGDDESTDEGTSVDQASSAVDHQASDENGSADSTPETDGEERSRGGRSGRSDRSGSDRSSGTDASDDDTDDTAEDGQRRRRRRRRRRGEDSAPSADDPAEVVVRVREPRSRQKAAEEVTGIQGSTRMEAKRQRRREGREAGRRRAPILSEAEFLARRESVVRKMVIRQREELTQIAVLENDILVEHYVDRESAASLIGNVYLGRVQNVLPSMEAAFIDIGRGRNAVLYAGEVDWDAFGANGQQRKVENVLKSGQSVLVQVTKDPVGAKGARLTSHVTLPGRYIVYAPGGHLSGISRKLPDNERKRLKSVLSDLVPDSASVIVRTAAEGASEDELVRDVNRLKAQWEDIERKVKAGSAPKLMYGEPDLTVRIVRDLFTEDFAELIIQGNGSGTDAYEAVDAYVEHVAPHLHDRMSRWDVGADGDLFTKYRLDEQISKALERKVFLPSGGSLIIDRTEAMTVIAVNTGKFTGSGGNLEATVTSNNLEAAEEIVRQLRLRDIGGIIVIDFIDMVLPSNRELLLRRLVECLGRDRTRHQVAEVTSLGLVQMTRKKIGTGLLEAFTTECEVCHGRGYEISDVPVETQKQPDGGSRDNRGGGNGGRGRGRGNSGGGSSNGGGNSNAGGNRGPVPSPPAPRAEGGSDPSEGQPEVPSDGSPAEEPATAG
ncbi:MAG TPA: Rne/Rng family ribonuclease [Microlunatus sp.]|nr:Rne/Rng family ribonuclease [Microlunatus sp.]